MRARGTDTLAEARRIAANPLRQRADAETRRAALAQVRVMDPVQVIDMETDRIAPPAVVWRIDGDGDSRRIQVTDWRRTSDGWAYHERLFDGDGREVGADGAVVPHGRLLVTITLPSAETAALRSAVLTRWDLAMAEESARVRSAAVANVSPALRAAILGERWEEESATDVLAEPPVKIDVDDVASMREVLEAITRQRAHEAGILGEMAEAAVAVALRDAPMTDQALGWMLSRLPRDLVTRAVAIADELRMRHPRSG